MEEVEEMEIEKLENLFNELATLYVEQKQLNEEVFTKLFMAVAEPVEEPAAAPEPEVPAAAQETRANPIDETDELVDGISDKRHLSFSAVIIEMYNMDKKSSLKDLIPQNNIYKLYNI